jgi:hypothetical protein
MVRRSNKSVSEILSSTNMSFPSRNDNHNDLSLLERKIILATEGFTWIDIILDGTDEQFKDVVKALNPQIYSQIIKPREK